MPASALQSKYDFLPIFLPTAEVERITQVDRKTLFRWRNRGFLAKSGQRTEVYTPKETVEILCLQEMRTILPAFPLEQFAGHARAIATKVLWHALHISKPWQFIGSPVERLAFEDALRANDNELLELCRRILKIPETDELHRFSAWDGREWTAISKIDVEEPKQRAPVRVLIDIFWLGDTFVERLRDLIYEARLKSSPQNR